MLRLSELVSIAYFVTVAIVAWQRPITLSRRARTSAASALIAVGILFVAWVPGVEASSAFEALRDWLPLVLLLLSYWIPASLVAAPLPAFEGWLLAGDRWFLASAAGRAVAGAPRAVRELLELGYLAVYPMVPAAFGVLLAQGLRSHADRFWTTVLTAEFVCYILLPLLPTRPPRQLELVPAYGGMTTTVRRLNLAILDRASNHWNTFPSGHVAGAAACALTLLPLAPAAGLVLAALTCLIAAGAVAGRYHYLADALAGLAVAAAAVSLIAW